MTMNAPPTKKQNTIGKTKTITNGKVAKNSGNSGAVNEFSLIPLPLASRINLAGADTIEGDDQGGLDVVQSSLGGFASNLTTNDKKRRKQTLTKGRVRVRITSVNGQALL